MNKTNVPYFWRISKDKYNLKGSYCSKCEKYFYPKKFICSSCGKKNLPTEKLIPKGEIISFSEVKVAPESFDYQTPYILGLIKLEQGPLILSGIVDCSFSDLNIEAQVEGVLRKYNEMNGKGVILYGLKFRLVKKK